MTDALPDPPSPVAPGRAVLAKRFDPDADTATDTDTGVEAATDTDIGTGTDADADATALAELRALVTGIGHEVVAVETQTRPVHNRYGIGPGLVDRLRERASGDGADVVVVDEPLHPGRFVDLEAALPVPVRDRTRLVLDVLATDGTDYARGLAGLAGLRDRRRRRRTAARETGADERGIVADLGRRIDAARTALTAERDRLATVAAERAGEATTVAVVGYTGAGSSTLVAALADDTPSAASDDAAVTPLTTRTPRRHHATIDGRPVTLVDTGGLLAGLGSWLPDPFAPIRAAVSAADVVVHTVDPTTETPLPGPLARRLHTVRTRILAPAAAGTLTGPDQEGTTAARAPATAWSTPVVPALTRCDRAAVDPDALRAARRVLSDAAATAGDTSSIPTTDGHTGRAIDALIDRLGAAMPERTATLVVPAGDAAMTLVSWAYDVAAVESVAYGDVIELTIRGRPAIVDEAIARAETAGGRVAADDSSPT